MKSDFWKNQWQEWRGIIFFAVFILIPVRSSLADWNWVPSESMNPTIAGGELVYVNKAAYDLRVPLTLQRLTKWSDPATGDIAILFSPEDRTRLVKRVIGVPGDTIEMKNNVLFINGERLTYSRLAEKSSAHLSPELRRRSLFAEEDLLGEKHAVMSIPGIPTPLRSFKPFTVPEGQYFVMGDNRDNSKDSRSFGLVDRKLFIGSATHVLASFNKQDKFQPRLKRFFTSLN